MTSKAIEYNRDHHGPAQTKQIQAIVGADPDGLWGPRTVAAVVVWQGSHQLTPDGMVGPVTLGAMCGGDYSGIRHWSEHADIQRLHRTKSRTEKDITEIVVHESVTTSWMSTQRTLARRDLGLHLMIHGDGVVSQHGEFTDVMSHCRGHNAHSIGIEIVNPYEPKYRRAGTPWVNSILAPWAHGGQYLLPTLAQCTALADVIAQLLQLFDIVPKWMGHGHEDNQFIENKFSWALMKIENGTGGIWAHQHIGDHSDGAWPLLVAYLINECGLSPEVAHKRAEVAATGVRRTAVLYRGSDEE